MILYIIGAGGHGKVVAEVAILMGIFDEIFFLDDNKEIGTYVLNCKVINNVDFNFIKTIVNKKNNFFVAVGDCLKRKELQEKLTQHNANIPTLVHPNASVSKFSKIEHGSLVCAGAILGPDSKIGQGTIINHSSTVDHDCNIGRFTHICPHSSLSGGVIIGDLSILGTGSRVIQGINIGRNCNIGAGSVVIRDISKNSKAFGIPARIIN